MSLSPSARFDLETLISVAQPKSLLFIGEVPTDLASDYVLQQSVLGVDVIIDRANLSDVNAIQKNAHTLYDLAIVSGVLENLEKPQGRQLLASLRDRLSRQYCVHVAIDNRDTVSQWSLTDFLSMALVRVNTYSLRDSSFVLFKYSIGSYKRTPDWLNANNWANPELWGKYWW
ncbi:MAG: DUF6231 family protein [Arenicella sp.]|jgi:hypothetical protein|nr:DUF6231 family protein [bacterium]MDG1904291.1 DUF6231 family protein [Arenicella sp.]HAU66866.1 hypothetical protein [Gammaproteobacteria bacterium]